MKSESGFSLAMASQPFNMIYNERVILEAFAIILNLFKSRKRQRDRHLNRTKLLLGLERRPFPLCLLRCIAFEVLPKLDMFPNTTYFLSKKGAIISIFGNESWLMWLLLLKTSTSWWFWSCWWSFWRRSSLRLNCKFTSNISPDITRGAL